MNTQPEALRLVDEIDTEELSIDRLETWMEEAAAELRRLHAENEALQNTKHYEAPRGFVLNPDYLVPELQAERDALLAASKAVVDFVDGPGEAKRPDVFFRIMGGLRAAIDAARGNL